MSTVQEEAEGGAKGRKYGLPGWMVHNIERLNLSTDFEQYACSPPESEGFLSEYGAHLDLDVDNPDMEHTSKSTGLDVMLNPDPISSHNELVKQMQTSCLDSDWTLAGTGTTTTPEIKFPTYKTDGNSSPVSLKHQSIFDAIKHDDILYSSPDTTPCATPEPSPAPQRKISFNSQDTVQSNPQKWFYLGGMKIQPKPKHLKGKYEYTPQSTGTLTEPQRKSVLDGKNPKIKTPTRDNIKLAISNFDINAVSPSSW